MTIRSYDWIDHHARIRGGKVAQRDLGTDRAFTYADMNDRCNRLANALSSELGVEFGDRVAVLANNNTNFFEVQFACWKLGAIFVPLNWRLAVPELEFIAGDCEPKVIIFDDDMADAANQVAKSCEITHRVDWEGASAEADAAVIHYEEMLDAASPTFTAVPTDHDTPLTVMYTSGTTGRPKGAIITHGMTFWNAVNCTEFYKLGSDMVNLCFLPCFHTGGLNVFANPAFHFGGTNVVVRSFDPAGVLGLLTSAEVGVTHFIGVPANYLFMSQVPEFTDASFPTIVAASVGGSPTPRPLIETWDAKGLPLQQAFGMTETSPLVLALPAEAASTKIGSAGVPGLHLEVRIVDDDGTDVTPGETGELWVRGPNITPGYWNRPEATAESFTDGFLHTGDAARQDDDGFYYVVDRWKDMYISGGENVYPAEVESVIFELPEIGEVAVIGVPDERWVEVGRALVVLKDGVEVDPDEFSAKVVNHCRAKLARFKVPQSVQIIPEIPHNATGKVLKRELRDQYST